jgi:hypothetical protein
MHFVLKYYSHHPLKIRVSFKRIYLILQHRISALTYHKWQDEVCFREERKKELINPYAANVEYKVSS